MEQQPQAPPKSLSDQLRVINTVIARLEDLNHESAQAGRYGVNLQHLNSTLSELDLLFTEFEVLIKLERIQKEENNIKLNREKISGLQQEVVGLKKKLGK